MSEQLPQPDDIEPIDDSQDFNIPDADGDSLDALTDVQDTADTSDIEDRLDDIEERLDEDNSTEAEPGTFIVQTYTDGTWDELLAVNGVMTIPAVSRTGNDYRFYNGDSISGAGLVQLAAGQALVIQQEDGTKMSFIAVSPAVLTSLGRITSVAATTNATTWTYAITFQDGSTANGYNSFEWNGTNPSMIQGSPGSLGVACGTDGSFTGTSCFVKPIGSTGWILFSYDTINGRWIFSAPNSAG